MTEWFCEFLHCDVASRTLETRIIMQTRDALLRVSRALNVVRL